MCRAEWLNQALLGKQAGRNASLGDPRGAGKTGVVLPSTAQGQGLWGQAEICGITIWTSRHQSSPFNPSRVPDFFGLSVATG